MADSRRSRDSQLYVQVFSFTDRGSAISSGGSSIPMPPALRRRKGRAVAAPRSRRPTCGWTRCVGKARAALAPDDALDRLLRPRLLLVPARRQLQHLARPRTRLHDPRRGPRGRRARSRTLFDRAGESLFRERRLEPARRRTPWASATSTSTSTGASRRGSSRKGRSTKASCRGSRTGSRRSSMRRPGSGPVTRVYRREEIYPRIRSRAHPRPPSGQCALGYRVSWQTTLGRRPAGPVRRQPEGMERRPLQQRSAPSSRGSSSRAGRSTRDRPGSSRSDSAPILSALGASRSPRVSTAGSL